MQRWRRRLFSMLLVYCAAMVLWASRPWTDTVALETPAGASPAFVEYRCPSVFSSGTDPEPAEEPAFPLRRRPCEQQGTHRALFVIDLAAAGVGMALLQRSSARYRAAATAADARDAELAAPA
ncbi:MAG: hypothetical protein ACR2MO_15720 [Acidimicrobiales bacterium]